MSLAGVITIGLALAGIGTIALLTADIIKDIIHQQKEEIIRNKQRAEKEDNN